MPTTFLLIVGVGIAVLTFVKLKSTAAMQKLWTTSKSGSQGLANVLSKKDGATGTGSSSKDGKKSLPGKKLFLYGGGMVGLVLLVLYADQIVNLYQASGFRFSDTGLGQVLVPHLGTRATDWVPVFAGIIALFLFLVKKFKLAKVWDAIIWTVILILAILLYFMAESGWREITSGNRERATYRAEQGYTAPVHTIKYHGLVGDYGPAQMVLEPGRWHSFDWPHNHCVEFYPETGTKARSVQRNDQRQVRSLGVERKVWVRTLKVGESWTPPGSTQSSTCS